MDRHHLYWPRTLYIPSKLAKEFREHRFNSIWLLRSDHDSIHHRFDGVPIPSEDVMSTYLDEARLLDKLGVCVAALEMIDTAIYEGRVRYHRSVEENRESKLRTIDHHMKLVNGFEILPSQISHFVVQQLVERPIAA